MKKLNLDVKKQLKGQWRGQYLHQREWKVCSFKGEELLNKIEDWKFWWRASL